MRIKAQPHQIDMLVILESTEELWDPGTAVQRQNSPLLFMKNHLKWGPEYANNKIKKTCNRSILLV